MINQIPSEGQARIPRAILKVGSTELNWTSWTIEHNGIYEAGTIHVTMPVPFSEWGFWAQQTEIIVDVYVGLVKDPDAFSVAEMTLMMTARIDDFNLDPATSTVTLAGRDLTSLFTDNKASADYRNMTSSQIVAALAANFPQITTTNIQPTKGSAGTFFTLDHVQMHHDNTMWTLMTYLAQHEGLQCFVLGRTLYFGEFGTSLSDAPYEISYSPPTDEYPIPQINAERIRFSHDLTISGDITVTVRSFHGMKNAAYSGTAKSDRTVKRIERAAKTVQSAQHYDFTYPNLSAEDCKKKANELYKQISLHEYKLDTTVPGDAVTFPWTPLKVSGTKTAFDTTYQIDHICRTFDKRGFVQNITARTAPAQESVKLS